jgi:hypothetical protein
MGEGSFDACFVRQLQQQAKAIAAPHRRGGWQGCALGLRDKAQPDPRTRTRRDRDGELRPCRKRHITLPHPDLQARHLTG